MRCSVPRSSVRFHHRTDRGETPRSATNAEGGADPLQRPTWASPRSPDECRVASDDLDPAERRSTATGWHQGGESARAWRSILPPSSVAPTTPRSSSSCFVTVTARWRSWRRLRGASAIPVGLDRFDSFAVWSSVAIARPRSRIRRSFSVTQCAHEVFRSFHRCPTWSFRTEAEFVSTWQFPKCGGPSRSMCIRTTCCSRERPRTSVEIGNVTSLAGRSSVSPKSTWSISLVSSPSW